MNALEHQLDYPFGERLPEPAEKHEVAPGIFWIRMPLPFVLNHINLWLVRDEVEGVQGWTVIDCGVSSDEIRAHWEQLFEHGLDGLPVLRVIVTHMHPDHVGLADWISNGGDKSRWSARVWMSLGDFSFAHNMLHGTGPSNAGGDAAAAHFARHGLSDPETLEQIRNRKTYFSSLVPSLPVRYRRMRDGDTIRMGGRSWRTIVGFGHAPEHMALYCEESGVLISGDMVLPRISTNVSVFDVEPEGNPLQLYLDSLEAYLPLPENTLVLPAHGKPFRGLHTRIQQLRDHHVERLEETREACRKAPQTARDIVQVIFRREFDIHQLTFAMGEALAHLHMLWLAGELVRTYDADGVYRFAPAA